MKTKESRFDVHDELTAPERSLPILKGALSTGGQLSNFLGVMAGAPAVLRAYARFRSELRQGALPLKSQQRIALAVAEHEKAEYALSVVLRTARGSSNRATSARRLCCGSSAGCSTSRGFLRCICSKRPAKRAGRTSSCSRRSRTPRWASSRR
ncbi:MAG: hypothetical protein E6G29_01460 [Actinobacteria bacterium]|nr:MAG: hypothetical protein E6G29_01460 [Actinomycetota bacterium]